MLRCLIGALCVHFWDKNTIGTTLVLINHENIKALVPRTLFIIHQQGDNTHLMTWDLFTHKALMFSWHHNRSWPVILVVMTDHDRSWPKKRKRLWPVMTDHKWSWPVTTGQCDRLWPICAPSRFTLILTSLNFACKLSCYDVLCKRLFFIICTEIYYYLWAILR